MESEKITIVDEERNPIGVDTRSEVHRKGLWHETFHCWLVEQMEGETFLYFQLRSMEKKDFPGLLDITAAGHILDDESIEDGVREVQEELGLDVEIEDLVQLGIIKTSIEKGDFIDNEFCHVYLLPWKNGFDGFHLQEEEVSGMYRASLEEVSQLIQGQVESIEVDGFESEPVRNTRKVGKEDFVPCPDAYYEEVLRQIENFYKK